MANLAMNDKVEQGSIEKEELNPIEEQLMPINRITNDKFERLKRGHQLGAGNHGERPEITSISPMNIHIEDLCWLPEDTSLQNAQETTGGKGQILKIDE